VIRHYSHVNLSIKSRIHLVKLLPQLVYVDDLLNVVPMAQHIAPRKTHCLERSYCCLKIIVNRLQIRVEKLEVFTWQNLTYNRDVHEESRIVLTD
jgi:hypothetical protein